MSDRLELTVYMKPEPQGSSKAFVIPGTNRAIVTSANSKMKPFRSEVTRMAMAELTCAAPMFGKHVAVQMVMTFTFLRPAGAPKSRVHPVVKPDVDKLQRAILDALTGVAYVDDSQVVLTTARKRYGPVESATVIVEALA